MPFMLSNEFFRILDSRGCATVQMPVTNPVVIRTTKTQPGTSPRSDFAASAKFFFKILNLADQFIARDIFELLRRIAIL
jgi:hypothetical protein